MTVIILAAFPLVAGYMVLVERKVLADLQVRLGPMRVGPHGFLQPIADALKLLFKEDIIPTDADQAIFWFAPCISVLHRADGVRCPSVQSIYVIADVNVGMLVVSAMSSVGILGIILGGWASNSHYPLLGALRSAAQLVSYEVALALRGPVRHHGGRHAQHGRDREEPAGAARLVRVRQLRLHDRAVRGLHGRGRGRNQPRAVRSPRSRIRAGGRLPHRVQRLPLGALHARRVRERSSSCAPWR